MTKAPLARFHARIREKTGNAAAAPVLLSAFGDSVTQGFTSAGILEPQAVYHHRIKEGLESAHPACTFSVLNAGSAGETANEALTRLDRDVLRHRPDLTLVAFGLNDSLSGMEGLAVYRDALLAIIAAIRTHTESDIILLTPNFMRSGERPLGSSAAQALAPTMRALQRDGVVAAHARTMRDVAQQCRVPVADVYAAWAELADSGQDTDALLANGLNHPTAEAHEIAAKLVLEVIAPGG